MDRSKKLLEEIQKCEVIEDMEHKKEITPTEIAEAINPRMGEIANIENEMVQEMAQEMKKENNDKTIDE